MLLYMQVSGLPCPDQKLVFETHSQLNMSYITNQMEMAVQDSGQVVYPITTGIKRKNLYTVAISVVGHEGVVQVLNLNFSELFLLFFHSYIVIVIFVEFNNC